MKRKLFNTLCKIGILAAIVGILGIKIDNKAAIYTGAVLFLVAGISVLFLKTIGLDDNKKVANKNEKLEEI